MSSTFAPFGSSPPLDLADDAMIPGMTVLRE
jgi:hypothetical protein